PEDNEPVSPHARGPVLASSTTVHPAGGVAVFETLRATGKMVASWKGELRGLVMACSVYCCAMATSGFCASGSITSSLPTTTPQAANAPSRPDCTPGSTIASTLPPLSTQACSS